MPPHRTNIRIIEYSGPALSQSLEEDWRGTESKLLEVQCEVLKSVMIRGAVTSAGVGPLCFIKSKVNAAVYQEILEHFMLPSADKLYGDADFLFQQDFSICPQWQNHFQVLATMILLCLIGQPTCLTWTPCGIYGYFQEKDEKQSIQQSRRAEGSIVSQQSHRLIASMPHLTDAGVCAKGAPTKYWVQMNILERTWTFLFYKSFFWLILENILIFWETGFWLSWAVSSNHQN